MSKMDDVAGDPSLIVTGGMAAIGNYAVVGHPVSHSRSPELHEVWFAKQRFPGVYGKEDSTPEELVQRGPSLPYEFSGLNITTVSYTHLTLPTKA